MRMHIESMRTHTSCMCIHVGLQNSVRKVFVTENGVEQIPHRLGAALHPSIITIKEPKGSFTKNMLNSLENSESKREFLF